ncbi:MAG: hypothetical protein C5B44_01175 [Acidobacteria bacterium]|nr:MAG: hypothetical protein C5B44_01175 [Acidobacteriota bacterium]
MKVLPFLRVCACDFVDVVVRPKKNGSTKSHEGSANTKSGSLFYRWLTIAFLTFSSLAAFTPHTLSSGLAPSLDKLKAEEVIARHLESIGPADKRAAVTTRIIAGTSLVIFRTAPTGQAAGRAVLASDGLKTLIGMSFQSPVYPREQLGFNGNSFVAAFITPGVRSTLGSFLMAHDVMFKQGLMGGVLSSAWPLLNLATRNAIVEYNGTKEIANYTMHEVRYLPHGGSDVKIRLYFDSENFRHLRSEYEVVIPAPMDTRAYANVEEREIRYKMTEEFSSFKTENGLTLPHTYKIRMSADGRGGTFLGDWELNLIQFTFNDKIDPAAFNIVGE